MRTEVSVTGSRTVIYSNMSSLPSWAIALIIVGVLVVAAAVTLIVHGVIKKNKKKQKKRSNNQQINNGINYNTSDVSYMTMNNAKTV